MQRNMDLIRLLLLDIEDVEEVDLSGYTHEEINYNKYLLVDAGLAEGEAYWIPDPNGSRTTQMRDAWIKDLTWEGHEFLDAARNESTWKSAMSTIAKSGGGFTFSVLKAVLIAAAKSQIGL